MPSLWRTMKRIEGAIEGGCLSQSTRHGAQRVWYITNNVRREYCNRIIKKFTNKRTTQANVIISNKLRAYLVNGLKVTVYYKKKCNSNYFSNS